MYICCNDTRNCPVLYSKAYSSKYFDADTFITKKFVSHFKQFTITEEYKTKYNRI